MGSQQFCLRWNNHQSNMLSVFDQLLQNEALVDVTLACDGLSLKAHKVVLSACSPYFQALFLDNPCQHPIVFMKDVRYSDLKALVDFMYKGEVNVSQEQLNAVLETAESLKVKGLAEVTPESAQSRGGGGGGGNGGGSVAGERGGDSRPSGGGGNGGDNHQHHHHHHLLSTYHQAAKVIRNAGSGLLMSDSYPRSSSGGTSGGDHNGGRESLSGAPHGGATSSSSPPPLPASSPRPSLAMSIMLDQMKRSHSPPAKRRKAKPRKRVAEHPMPSSDHEDSDALDLSTASPEQMDPSCIDMNDGDGGRDRDRERCSSYELSGGMSHLGGALHLSSSGEHHRKLSGGGGSGHDLSTSIATSNNSTSQHMSALHLDVEDNSATSQEKDYNSNQSQAQASPSGMASHRIPIPKIPPLVSVMSTAPLPSTSATQASIQDIRRLCQFSRQSQQHKPTWTEEDMVQALEAVQSGRLTYALAARKFDIPKATLHYYVILMKAVEAVRSGRMTAEIAAIKYNVRTSILLDCLFGRQGSAAGGGGGSGGGGGGGAGAGATPPVPPAPNLTVGGAGVGVGVVGSSDKAGSALKREL